MNQTVELEDEIGFDVEDEVEVVGEDKTEFDVKDETSGEHT